MMKRANRRIEFRNCLYVVFCLVSSSLFRAATATRAAEDPAGEPGDLRTYDVPRSSAASFDGDVRDHVRVPTNLGPRSIDFESHLQELETPIGAPEAGRRSSGERRRRPRRPRPPSRRPLRRRSPTSPGSAGSTR